MNIFKKAAQYTPSSIFKKSVGGAVNSLFKKNSTAPSDEISAKLAEASYILGQEGKTNDGIEKTNKFVKDTGFELVPNLSNKQISTFKNKDGNYNIAHKGTCLSCDSKGKDLFSDLALGLGFNSSQVSNRMKRTENIIDQIDALNPDAKINISGHSLGGHTSSYAMANSKKVRDRVNKLSTYNTGANPFFDAGLKVDKKTKQELDKKVVHHRKKGDLISAGLLGNSPFGEIKNYKSSSYNPLQEHKIDLFS